MHGDGGETAQSDEEAEEDGHSVGPDLAEGGERINFATLDLVLRSVRQQFGVLRRLFAITVWKNKFTL